MIFKIIYIITFVAFFISLTSITRAMTKTREIKYIKTFWILNIVFDAVLSGIAVAFITGIAFLLSLGVYLIFNL